MDKPKFENTVLAILKTGAGMGSLQLRKALIIADALHNTLHGESITGAGYVKHRYGPVPDNEAFETLSRMAFPEHMIDVVEEPVGYYTQNSYFPAQEPDYSLFTRSQIDIINYASRTARKYTATRLSDMTHDDAYNNTPMGGEIPLELVCRMTLSGYDTEAFTKDETDDVKAFLRTDEASNYAFI